MLSITINASGKTRGDLEQAVEEAVRRFNAGNVCGHDRNQSGDFRFEVEGDEEESDQDDSESESED